MNRAFASALIGATLLLLNGCTFRKLQKDVTRLESMVLLGGHVSRAQDDAAPIIVVLTTPAPATVVDSFVLTKPGAYFFFVPPGTYRIAAFVDRNRDFTYQPDQEPAAYYGAPTDVSAAAGGQVAHLDLQIDAGQRVRLDFPISVSASGKSATRELPDTHLGDVATINDPRFSAENGNLGLWQPVEFLFDVGAGIYFLEPFDDHKMPVLFVHGAGGHPDQFRYLIEHLDRTKFQPWLLYYPSGIDLDVAARGVARRMNRLVAQFGFQRLAVVAHSMGGLVSRAFINQMTADGEGSMLRLFVSMSTPWSGYPAAAAGAEHSPVVMPMWKDMAPGSPFLTEIFQAPLPPQCPYYLMFSYSGHSLLLREANDGTVALSSELARPAQQAATRLYGFDESHDGILSTAEVSQTLNTLLAQALLR